MKMNLLTKSTLKLSRETLEKVVAHELTAFDERIHFDTKKAECLPIPLQNTINELGRKLIDEEKRI